MIHIITATKHWEVSASRTEIEKWLQNHKEIAVVLADGYSGENHFEGVLNAEGWRLFRNAVYRDLYLRAPDGEIIETNDNWISGARKCLEIIANWQPS